MSAGDVAEHKVRRVEVVHESLFVLVLDRNGLEFMPGDCVALHTGTGQSRPYSIASGDGEGHLQFVIRKMEEGEVSPWLMARKPGDAVGVSAPFGWFRPGQEIGDSPFIFIATGTGVAPFLSCSKSPGLKAPAGFLYGVRREADAVGADRLANWCDLQQAISRERTENHHFGRLTDLLDTMPMMPETHYYLCGLESMISEVTAWLEGRGVNLSYIHREVFFHG